MMISKIPKTKKRYYVYTQEVSKEESCVVIKYGREEIVLKQDKKPISTIKARAIDKIIEKIVLDFFNSYNL